MRWPSSISDTSLVKSKSQCESTHTVAINTVGVDYKIAPAASFRCRYYNPGIEMFFLRNDGCLILQSIVGHPCCCDDKEQSGPACEGDDAVAANP